MLRILFCGLLLGVGAQASAQVPNPLAIPIRELFRVDAGFSGAYSPGDLEGYGMGGIVEIKYNLTPHFSVGSRTDATMLFGVDFQDGGQEVNAGIRALIAEHLVVEVLAFPKRVTPYVGLGLGKYVSVGDFGGDGGAVITFSNPFGLAPHAGLDFKTFRLTATYNKLFDSATLAIGVGEPKTVSSDYFSIEMTFLSFGGRRKQDTRWFPETLPPLPPFLPASAPTPEPTPQSAPATQSAP